MWIYKRYDFNVWFNLHYISGGMWEYLKIIFKGLIWLELWPVFRLQSSNFSVNSTIYAMRTVFINIMAGWCFLTKACVSLLSACSVYVFLCVTNIHSKGAKALSPVSSQKHACTHSLTRIHRCIYTLWHVSRKTDVQGTTLHQLSHQVHSVN